ncbi:MAG: alpha/beta fold hydrolase [Polyangiaceae bacterium]
MMKKSFVRIEGTDIHWAELGQGRPIVLLHGLSDSHRTWGKIASELARTRRVLMPDLPGHGLSSRPDESYALAWHAQIMAGWLDALQLGDVDIVGHSFGGGVAQWLLLAHRQRIRRLALVASGGLGRDVMPILRLCAATNLVEHYGQAFMSSGTRLGMRFADGAYDREDIEILSWMNAMPGSARALARTVRDVIDWRGQRRHFLDRVHELPDLPPLALYWGDLDNVIPIGHGTEIASKVDGATLTRFDGCGHFPHRQRPKEFTRAIEAFLDAPALAATRLHDHAVRVSSSRALALRAPVRRPSIWRRAWSSFVEGLRGGVASRGIAVRKVTASP